MEQAKPEPVFPVGFDEARLSSASARTKPKRQSLADSPGCFASGEVGR